MKCFYCSIVLLFFVIPPSFGNGCDGFSKAASALESSYHYNLVPYEEEDAACLGKNGYSKVSSFNDREKRKKGYLNECLAAGGKGLKHRLRQLVDYAYQCNGVLKTIVPPLRKNHGYHYDLEYFASYEEMKIDYKKVKKEIAPDFIVDYLSLARNKNSSNPECQIYATNLNLDTKSSTQEWGISVNNTCYEGLDEVKDPPADVTPYIPYSKLPPKKAIWLIQVDEKKKIKTLLQSWGSLDIRLDRHFKYQKIRTEAVMGGLEVAREWVFDWKIKAYKVDKESVITQFDGARYK